MQINKEDFNKIKQLEESLWIAKIRFDKEYMNSILSPHFFEFGRSGRIYKREETLSAPFSEINAKLPLRDFKVHSITNDVVLVTYMSEVQYDELEVGNRSSLWLKTSTGWQLQFHQGTVTK
ncbi:MAG: nuclear transport factor 2 family protein [bacterium]|nr:nuclear transport factor 2 family protein [bacterium]